MTIGIENIVSSVSLNTVKAGSTKSTLDFDKQVNTLLDIKQQIDQDSISTNVAKKSSESDNNRIEDLLV